MLDEDGPDFAPRSEAGEGHGGSGGPVGSTIRIAALGVLALGLANCSSPHATGKRGNKYGVSASPRVIAEGQPIPKGGGRETTGKPYVVAGRTYVPHAGRGYDREGWASWYGTAFHGRLTANGEIFDRDSIAAAHPTLPLPSYVRVTNLTNRRSLIVRVNDRGPYERDRVIDVSERAADALGFKRHGVSRVRVRYVGRASVNGSDDAKLFATLRLDGSDAPLNPGGRTMLAGLRDEPARPEARPSSARDPIPLPRPVQTEPDDDEPTPRRSVQAQAPERMEETAVPAPRPPSRLVEAGAAPLPRAARPVEAAGAPLSLRPPDPLSFAGIY